ncbi:MAG: ParA family protein [Lachnospiraceae bacterium]
MNIPAIAFFNGKGGCGKTTGLINTAGVLSANGEKLLIIDMDKQRNTTDIFLQDKQSLYEEGKSQTLYDVFAGNAALKDVIKKAYLVGIGQRKAYYHNIDVVPADIRFQNENGLKELKVDIREELERLVEDNGYTYILIDMPPSNEMINTICFTQIVNNIIVPFSPDIFSVSGYNDLMQIISEARKINDNLNIIGIYLSRYRSRNYQIKEALKSFGKMFIDEIQIPFSAQIEDTVLEGRPISYYKRKGKSREAFEKLTEIIISRCVV